MKCKDCGSKAINPGYNERGQDMMNLCDACYWKTLYKMENSIAENRWSGLVDINDVPIHAHDMVEITGVFEAIGKPGVTVRGEVIFTNGAFSVVNKDGLHSYVGEWLSSIKVIK